MKVYCCGFNGFFQIREDVASISSPFHLLGLNNIVDISFSWNTTVAITDDCVYISGFNDGQIYHLKKLETPHNCTKVLKVSCAEERALFTTADGKCWQFLFANAKWSQLLDFTVIEEKKLASQSSEDGSSYSSKKPTQRASITKICCGCLVCLALDENGFVYRLPSPLHMGGIQIVDIACGLEHSIMMDNTGKVYSVGSGMRGQLGNEELETTESPQEILALGGLRIVKISAGGWHSAVVSESGVLYTWGWNNAGQLGFPTAEDSERKNFRRKGKRKLSSTCVENVERNTHGGNSEQDLTDEKKTTGRGNNDAHTAQLELTVDSQEEKWKNTSIDSAGFDTSQDMTEFVTVLAVPRVVDFPTDNDIHVIKVSCGSQHTVIMAGDGSIWGCGWNAYGQLGKCPETCPSLGIMSKIEIPHVEPNEIHDICCSAWNTALIVK